MGKDQRKKTMAASGDEKPIVLIRRCRIEGQTYGLQRVAEKDPECVDSLTQITGASCVRVGQPATDRESLVLLYH
jgi:hypothetical protein